MFFWLMVGACVIIMVRAAEMDGRSRTLWGAITFVICIVCAAVIPLPLISVAIGLAISFAAMWIANVTSSPNTLGSTSSKPLSGGPPGRPPDPPPGPGADHR